VNIKKYIREIPSWPITGVSFKDITTILQDPTVFKYTIDELTKPFLNRKINKVIAIDARGFLLATPVAYLLGAGVSLVRKKGKLPFTTIEESYQMEYGSSTLCMHQDAIVPGDNVLIVDDLLATGGTLEATIKMIERLGGSIIGCSLIIDLPYLGGSQKLKKYNLHFLTSYSSE
jgi:adenine phosphoribosyltransferase